VSLDQDIGRDVTIIVRQGDDQFLKERSHKLLLNLIKILEETSHLAVLVASQLQRQINRCKKRNPSPEKDPHQERSLTMLKTLLLLLPMMSKRSLITEEDSVASADPKSPRIRMLSLTKRITKIRDLIQELITSKITEGIDLVVKSSKRLMMNLLLKAQDLADKTIDSLMFRTLVVPIALNSAVSKILDSSKIEDQLGLKTKDLINISATLSTEDARLATMATDLLLEDVVAMETSHLLQDSPSSTTSLR